MTASGRKAGTVHAAIAVSGGAVPPPPLKAEPAPPELLSVLSLTAVGGKQVMVYTCEPTVLPPFGSAAKAKRSKRSVAAPR